MSIRICIYKGCEHCIDLRNKPLSSNITLFSFPKNPERRRKWIELGQVRENIHESDYFFCSDHFDKKFLAVNNRRTILVGEALPFPYVESEIDEAATYGDDNLNYVTYELNKSIVEGQEYSNDRDIIVESTTITNEMENNLDEQSDKSNEEFVLYTDGESNKEPRMHIISKKGLEDVTQAGPSKKLKISPKLFQNVGEIDNINIHRPNLNFQPSSGETPSFTKKGTSEDVINLDELIDSKNKNVTTFIFKGEEYVQMPKEHYISEKMELMNKLRKMEHILQAIKSQLSTIDI